MKTFKQYLKEDSGLPYHWNDDVCKFWCTSVSSQGKLTCTDSVNNEYNFTFRVFLEGIMNREFSYDFYCKGPTEASVRAEKAYNRAKSLLKKELTEAIKKLDKNIESIRV